MAGYAAMRAQLENDLAERLEPGAFHIVMSDRNVDRPSKPNLIVKFDQVERHPAAQGVLLARFVITVVSELTTPAEADFACDRHLDTLLAALQPITWVAFRNAQKAQYKGKYTCYDIHVEAITAIKKEA